MDLPVLLLLEDDDVVITKRALEIGAFLCIKKPLPLEIAKYLWLHVLREKKFKLKENEQLREFMTHNKRDSGFEEEDLMRGYITNVNYKLKKKATYSNYASQDEGTSLQHHDIFTFKKKDCTEWTQELHGKFMAAVRKLGEGRCYPKDILELMNVPGLTRMQVASHLQKCRRGNWQPPDERKSKVAYSNRTFQPTSSRAKQERFGRMPQLGDNSEMHRNIQEIHENTQEQYFSIYSSKAKNAIGDDRGKCPNEQYLPGLRIEPHDANGHNPFSHVGLEANNVGHLGLALVMDNAFKCVEQLLLAPESSTSSTNSSVDPRYISEDYHKLLNLDSMNQISSSAQQEPRMNYSGNRQGLHVNRVYSNQMPAIRETVMDWWDEASKLDNDRETRG